jgi:hypothetical protein
VAPQPLNYLLTRVTRPKPRASLGEFSSAVSSSKQAIVKKHYENKNPRASLSTNAGIL